MDRFKYAVQRETNGTSKPNKEHASTPIISFLLGPALRILGVYLHKNRLAQSITLFWNIKKNFIKTSILEKSKCVLPFIGKMLIFVVKCKEITFS